MTLVTSFSLGVGTLGGAVHAYMARRHTSAVLAGEIPNRFGVRFGLISLRYVMTFCAMGLALWSGACEPLLVGIGMAVGFVGFNLLCVVKKWM